jgi:hypothetical protein
VFDIRLLVREAPHLQDGQHRVRRRRLQLAHCGSANELCAVLATEVS